MIVANYDEIGDHLEAIRQHFEAAARLAVAEGDTATAGVLMTEAHHVGVDLAEELCGR